jgi:putative transposase
MVMRGLSERRALTVVCMSASALRYRPRPDRDAALRERLVALAHRHRRDGAGMIYLTLRQEGRVVNHQRVDRLYAEARLQVKRRRRKKVPVVDDATTEAVAIVPARALGGGPITRVLDQLAVSRGLPQVLRTDNGPEFCGRALLTWAHERGLTLRLIEPGKPNQNAYIESFNGRFRDECLNEHWFTSLAHAQVVIETWRREYNDERPKKGLGGLTPRCICFAVDGRQEDSESNRRILNGSATESGGTSSGVQPDSSRPFLMADKALSAELNNLKEETTRHNIQAEKRSEFPEADRRDACCRSIGD